MSIHKMDDSRTFMLMARLTQENTSMIVYVI